MSRAVSSFLWNEHAEVAKFWPMHNVSAHTHKQSAGGWQAGTKHTQQRAHHLALRVLWFWYAVERQVNHHKETQNCALRACRISTLYQRKSRAFISSLMLLVVRIAVWRSGQDEIASCALRIARRVPRRRCHQIIHYMSCCMCSHRYIHTHRTSSLFELLLLFWQRKEQPATLLAHTEQLSARPRTHTRRKTQTLYAVKFQFVSFPAERVSAGYPPPHVLILIRFTFPWIISGVKNCFPERWHFVPNRRSRECISATLLEIL